MSQRYRPPKFSRRFPRQNPNRYYHFYPESLFRTRTNVPHTETPSRSHMDMNIGIGGSSSSSAGKSRSDGSRQAAEENYNNIQEAPSGSLSHGSQQQQQHPQHRPGIGWADVAQQQGDQIQAPIVQEQQEQDSIQQAPTHSPHSIRPTSSVPGRFETTCHLEGNAEKANAKRTRGEGEKNNHLHTGHRHQQSTTVAVVQCAALQHCSIAQVRTPHNTNTTHTDELCVCSIRFFLQA